MGFRQNSVVFNKNLGHSIGKLQLSSNDSLIVFSRVNLEVGVKGEN